MLYFLLSTLVLTLYIDVVLSLSTGIIPQYIVIFVQAFYVLVWGLVLAEFHYKLG